MLTTIFMSFSLYFIVWLLNGTPAISLELLRSKLPSLEEDFGIAILSLVQLSIDMTQLVGFRFPMEPIYVPLPLSFAASPDGCGDGSDGGSSSGRYPLRSRTGFRRRIQSEPITNSSSLKEWRDLFLPLETRWIFATRLVQGLWRRIYHPGLSSIKPSDALVQRNQQQGQEEEEEEEMDLDYHDDPGSDDDDDIKEDDHSDDDIDDIDDDESVHSDYTTDPRELYEELFFLRQDQEEWRDEEEYGAAAHYHPSASAAAAAARTTSTSSSTIISSSEMARLCVVCASEPRDIVLFPCRCLCLCDGCREEMGNRVYQRCPTCRKQVDGYSKIYMP